MYAFTMEIVSVQAQEKLHRIAIASRRVSLNARNANMKVQKHIPCLWCGCMEATDWARRANKSPNSLSVLLHVPMETIRCKILN